MEKDHQVKVAGMDGAWRGVHMGWNGKYEACEPTWGP